MPSAGKHLKRLQRMADHLTGRVACAAEDYDSGLIRAERDSLLWAIEHLANVPRCQICRGLQPCPTHGRTPVDENDFQELTQWALDQLLEPKETTMEEKELLAGTVVHIYGFPVELVEHAKGRTFPSNWPLIEAAKRDHARADLGAGASPELPIVARDDA